MIKTRLMKSIFVLFFSALLVFGLEANAQTLKVNPKTFSMTIFGTTNVHNFDSKVTQVSGEVVMKGNKQVQSISIEIPVRGIKSKEKLMDTKTYETFNDSKYPTISFKTTEVSGLQITGSDVSVSVTGNLSMAGVTQKISFKSTGKILKPGSYQFTGSIPIKMTDFKMKPPTAMLGMMKVGDAVTLKFDATFEGAAIN